jgi:SAM-dependent methyltransferase
MSWVRLQRHIPRGTRLVVVSTTERYRRLAGQVSAQDTVLEIGCSTGEATRRLVETGARVVAVDVSKELTARLAEDLPQANVARLDGRDGAALRALCPEPDVIFLDVGGDALLPNVTSALRVVLLTYRPRLIVVRSYELAVLQGLVAEVELPEPPAGATPPRQDDAWLRTLIDLSRSAVDGDRVFAARHLRMLGTEPALARLMEMEEDAQNQVRRVVRRARQERDGKGEH